MSKKMLIDATHLEEKRVVVVDGVRLDELDIETSTKKQIKGNIYLAKVARVEPSLQAAFVDYGGNRHGFLAFGEIHPDYYQIPVADREALKEVLSREERDDDDEKAQESEDSVKVKGRRRRKRAETETAADAGNREDGDREMADAAAADPAVTEKSVADVDADNDRVMEVETVTETEADYMHRARPKIKNYRIQEVIHRGQILLVQVTKEERGNKGAALTTYLSLAGRYCVLMPNSGGRGGVSRKITNMADRKKLKAVIAELDMPEGMSVIVRTAGKERTKSEIKRDYEYLIKTWVQIRDKTIESTAPTLIHEECDIIKRALRDMYTRDIAEIYVEGEEEYRVAREFMKMLTPSHAKKIHLYKDDSIPLFYRYQVEAQLEAIHNNVVQLKSGAYLVMDQTEALVAIDVNSGRATKERNIEETALKTNLEAADEIARQLRLRDMAGLVVIDFIDMEEPRNNHAVERRMKEALKRDRARVQMGRITGFGLMELSRQRLHSSFIESSYSVCPHCRGKGMMRSVESAAIHTVHLLEEEALKRRFSEIRLTIPTAVALYVLNNKRGDLTRIEQHYNVVLTVEGDDSLPHPIDYRIERVVRDDVDDESGEKSENPTDDGERKPDREDGTEAPNDARRPHKKRQHRKNKREHAHFDDANEDAFSQNAVEAADAEVIVADDLFEEGLREKDEASADPASETHRENQEAGGRHRRFKKRWNNKKRFEKETENASENEVPTENSEERSDADDTAPVAQDKKQTRNRRRFSKPRYRKNRMQTESESENASFEKEQNAQPVFEDNRESADARLPEQVSETPKPRKKGWWQRFSGE